MIEVAAARRVIHRVRQHHRARAFARDGRPLRLAVDVLHETRARAERVRAGRSRAVARRVGVHCEELLGRGASARERHGDKDARHQGADGHFRNAGFVLLSFNESQAAKASNATASAAHTRVADLVNDPRTHTEHQCGGTSEIKKSSSEMTTRHGGPLH